MDPQFWQGKRVLLTGHTGFKGSWLSLWLARLGAQLHGLALDPPTEPSLFEVARVREVLTSDQRADIRDYEAVRAAMQRVQPDLVMHLAAQALVPQSYRRPIETYAVNVMGTAHVLEAARAVHALRAILVVTTDKCYANREWVYPYRESDELGGFDPYSSSKACAELVAATYRSSFFSTAGIALATARAGNVIGGGDWTSGRLVPDCLRAHLSQEVLRLRSPDAVRPWQHVLEPLSGYLQLAQALCGTQAAAFATAWNFGPRAEDIISVRALVDRVCTMWPLTVETGSTGNPETSLLQLDSSRARTQLGWRARWTLQQSLASTLDWYRAWSGGEDMHRLSVEQIGLYESAGAQ